MDEQYDVIVLGTGLKVCFPFLSRIHPHLSVRSAWELSCPGLVYWVIAVHECTARCKDSGSSSWPSSADGCNLSGSLVLEGFWWEMFICSMLSALAYVGVLTLVTPWWQVSRWWQMMSYVYIIPVRTPSSISWHCQWQLYGVGRFRVCVYLQVLH